MVDHVLRTHGVRRVYETTRAGDGTVALRLHDRVVDLGSKEKDAYDRLVEWIPTTRAVADLTRTTGMDEARLSRFASALVDTGLLYRRASLPETVSGKDFYAQHFEPVLDAWLSEAFSHPFWERMTSGKGSKRLHAGWTMELYHYTRN